jgi:hypothetical protein
MLIAFGSISIFAENINHLNRPIIINVIEAEYLYKEEPRPDVFMAEFYQTFKEVAPILLKLF